MNEESENGASHIGSFISKLLQGGKNGGFLLNYSQTSLDCFVLQVSTVGRFQNRICIVSIITSAGQEKENKTLYKVHEEKEAVRVDSR